MTYKLNLKSIWKHYKFDSSKRHSVYEAKFLPFVTKISKQANNFQEITAEFSRLTNGKKLAGENLVMENVLESVAEKVTFNSDEDVNHLKLLIEKLFFTEEKQLSLLHPSYFYYVPCNEGDNEKVAAFLRDVFWEEKFQHVGAQSDQELDVMTQLLFKSLPELKEASKEKSGYKNAFPQMAELFAMDYEWLQTKPELYVAHLEKFLKFYYFFYTSQFILQCSAMFDERLKSDQLLYFNLEWESTSKSRTSYLEGWNKVERSAKQLFSHAILLDFLNHVDGIEKPLTYPEIHQRILSLSEKELEVYEESLLKLTANYQEALSEVKWGSMPEVKNKYTIPVFNSIYRLFHIIDFQFRNSGRKTNYEVYAKWFTRFSNQSFLKFRGRLGHSLNLNADYLLFLTKLILKNQKKMRLNKLFEEFENRGIAFDRDTQNAIIARFEAINILEKKSDSGDALYVKSFL